MISIKREKRRILEQLSRKMIKLKLFEKYFICFYLCGLSPFISFDGQNKKPPIILVYLPRLSAILSLIFISFNFYYQLLRAENTMMSYFVMTFSIYMAFFESIYFSSKFCSTFQTLSISVQNFEQSWQIQCSFVALERRFRRKFILQISVVLSGLLVKYYVPSHFVQDLALTMAFLYKCIHLSYATMYIDFIRHLQMCLCNRIKLELRNCDEMNKTNGKIGVREKIRLLRQIKLIHFKLWRFAQCVNKQFGYFLTVVPVDTVSAVTYSFYWLFIFLRLHSPQELRKNFSCSVTFVY